MEYLPTIIAALVVFMLVFLAVRSIIRKRKWGDCGCGCENCAGCGSVPAKKEIKHFRIE